jgi:hypothetical protein
MNVHDSPLKLAQKFPFQNSHETGQGHQLDLGFRQRLQASLLGIVVQFGSKLTWINKLGRQLSLASMFENAGCFDVAEDDGNLRRYVVVGTSIGNSREIGPFAGSEHTETKFGLHPPCLQGWAQVSSLKANYANYG